MKKIFCFIFLTAYIILNINARSVYSINDGWLFRLGATNQGEEGWEIVSLPHTWNDKDCLDDIPGYTRTIGWYKKTINVDKSMLEKALFLHFEGANQHTEVYINNKKIGEHSGGYTFFCFDITSFVHEGKNELFVAVDNSEDPNIPPLSADFTFFGGIYRDVSLISTSPIHISNTHYASSGVYITPSSVTDEIADINIRTMLTNKEESSKKIYVEHKVFSSDGICISKTKDKVTLKVGENQEYDTNIKIKNPCLWNTETPYLYRLQTILLDKDGNIIDEVSNPFGIRTFSFTTNEGFVLNHKPIKLIGTNRHQCYYEQGNALRDEMHVRDIKLLNEMGGNFLRVAHYPQDKMVLSACDRMGIVTSVEIPIINAVTMSEEFSKNCVEMMKEMIYQCYNSPSVCIWTYMNEIMLRPTYTTDKSINKNEYLDYLYNIASKIEETAKKIDPMRYTMLPCHGNLTAYEEAKLVGLPDILGMNLYNGWYGGNFNGFESTLDKIHKKYPQKPIIVSEYGADVDSRIHSYKPERFDFSVDYGVLYHKHYLPEILKRKFVVASAVWNLNDFHSEGRMDAIPHINCKGLVTLDRTPKDTYRYYQAMLKKEPFIAIGGNDWKNRSGVSNNEGICYLPVSVYSNLKEITLKNNGIIISTNIIENGSATFNVPFKNGINKLEAIGTDGTVSTNDLLKVNIQLVPKDLKNKTFTELNMLLGSNREFEDRKACIAWLPEKEYEDGSWGYIGGNAYRAPTKRGSQPASNLDIYGTDEDPIFQTQRRGIKSFKADLPDGDYIIYLYWAELSGGNSESLAYMLDNIVKDEKTENRIFHVDINGKRIINSLNIVEETGTRRGVIKKIPISIYNNEGLNINFIPQNGETMLSAIRLIKCN